MTEEEILREDHGNGECVNGCKWCHEERRKFMAALMPLSPGNHLRHCTIKFQG